MASTQQSPVIIERPSSPPHSLAPSTTSHLPASSESSVDRDPAGNTSSTSDSTTGRPELLEVTQMERNEDTLVEDAAALHHSMPDPNDGDDSSNSGSNSESSNSTETPHTISTPRSSAHDSGQPLPDSSAMQLDTQNTEGRPSQTQAEAQSETEQSTSIPPSDPPAMPPLPVDISIPVADPIPDWVKHEEDTSEPDAEELKEIENDKNELNATDSAAMEKEMFTDLDDPDLRPCKKIRLSLVVQGVRGTRENPNRARIMTSPSVKIDGNYWSIKFFPRGFKSRNSLAAFVRCSPVEPECSKLALRGSFKCYEGPPDMDLSKAEPTFHVELIPADNDVPPKPTAGASPNTVSEDTAKETSASRVEDEVQEDEDDDNDSISGDEDDGLPIPPKPVVVEDFRVSAQLGLVVYNPAEPRTCYTSSVSHQFYPLFDECGRDPLVSQYEEIHRRKRGQRQALLRNDTLAIDAYIRVYEDPTKALFWDFTGEPQWDSKNLAGYFPMGTRLLYHSPATAGITAYSLLAPFRRVIQGFNAGAWRKDSSIRPCPLIAHLQLMLFQMRHMNKEELYIHLDSVIHEITRSGESFDNVNMFWETFRRSIEIEGESDSELISSLQNIFGPRDFVNKLPLLPVKNVDSIQDSANQVFEKTKFKQELPDFLPLTLQRQSFDAGKRQWQLHNDRVRISEELDLSRFSTDGDAEFVLYGMIVHDGDRTSGKFFSVLRPTGPGGKWLVFSDGSGNKVFSYTRKRISEYEGLDPPELKKSPSSGQTMHTALYLRKSCLKDYLLDQMESFKLPLWLKPYLEERYHYNEDNFESATSTEENAPVQIEIFWDKIVGGQEGKLDLYKLKSHPKARSKEYRQTFTADCDATLSEVHDLVASALKLEGRAFKLWGMNYPRLGGVSKGYMSVLRDSSMVRSCLGSSDILTIWLTIVPNKCDVAEETLMTNFRSIGGQHVEAPPRPTIEPPALPKASIESEADAAGDGVPGEASTSGAEISLQGSESDTPSQVIATGLEQSASSSMGNNGFSAESTAAAVTIEQEASPDAEQEAVREAVQHTVQNIGNTSMPMTDAVDGVRTSDALQVTEATNGSPATPAVDVHPASNVLVDPEPSSLQQAVSSPEGNPVSHEQRAPVMSPEIHSEEIQSTSPTDEIASVSNEDTAGPPVVHGHLVEASSHEESSVPIGIPIAIGNDRIIILSGNQEEISAADAEYITSIIAADIEAAERERQAGHVEGRNTGGDEAELIEVDSRPSTPRQRVVDVYGFLHIFDAEQQKFTAHSTFMVPGDTTISSMVRKQLNYDEEKSFHLWKRDGTYRTTGVSLESSFMDASLPDCCEVIVGEHLGEKKMVALKAEAKYVDPGQLMRHLAMVQRKHPTLVLSSAEAVEISEFGGDFYRGPLVRGQRHGQQCFLITQSGDTYDGPLVAGQKSGDKGRMVYQNGDVYNGGWLDDQKHGQGEFVEQRTGNRYVGGYENDKRWGKGVTYWEVADQQAALCQICYFEEVDALFYRCGHVVACYACAKQCISDSNGCPVCRRPIEAVVRMYRS